MRAIPSLVATVLSLLLVVIALPAGAGAQVATPAATPAALGAADCTVDPIDPATYGAAALAAMPAATDAVTPDPATGEPADDATVFAVYDTIAQSIACTNAGDLARLLAVIDPSYAQTLLGVPAEQVQAAIDAAASVAPAQGGTATPLVDDNDQSAISSTLGGIDDIVTLPDGQVAATVQIDSPQTGPVTTIIYLRMGEDRYLITNYVFLAPDATPAA